MSNVSQSHSALAVVVGMRKDMKRNEFIRHCLTLSQEVWLVRQPNNSIDPNAFQVQVWDEAQNEHMVLGYLDRASSAILAPLYDADPDGITYTARLQTITAYNPEECVIKLQVEMRRHSIDAERTMENATA